MDTIAPEFSTCHCYEIARRGCAVSDCLRDRFQAVATPCTLHVWADSSCSSPSSITRMSESKQGCGPGALPTWLASCEMSPAAPVVWMPSFKDKYRKASLSCKLSCSLSASLNILVTALYFSLRAAMALLSSDAAAASVSPATFLNWVHFCMVPLAMTLKSNKESCCSEVLCAHPLRKQKSLIVSWRQPWCTCSRKRWPHLSDISSIWIKTYDKPRIGVHRPIPGLCDWRVRSKWKNHMQQ